MHAGTWRTNGEHASLQFARIILNSAGMRLPRIHRIGEEMTLLQDNPQLIAVARAAKRLGISRDTIDRLIKTGEVRVVRIGGRVMVPQMEIERIVMGQARESAEITAAQPVRTRATVSDSATVRNLDQDVSYAEKIRNFVWASEEEKERCSIFMGPNAEFWAKVIAMGDRQKSKVE
jgi:excisionase family DNA binding protein